MGGREGRGGRGAPVACRSVVAEDNVGVVILGVDRLQYARANILLAQQGSQNCKEMNTSARVREHTSQ